MGTESLANHDHIPKKAFKSSKFVRVKAFLMYGGIGVSAPSLHTDSLISRHFVRMVHARPHLASSSYIPVPLYCDHERHSCTRLASEPSVCLPYLWLKK